MCALDSLWCQIKRQTSWILNLHTVIINSNARSQIILLQLPMAKGIRQSLTQGLSRFASRRRIRSLSDNFPLSGITALAPNLLAAQFIYGLSRLPFWNALDHLWTVPDPSRLHSVSIFKLRIRYDFLTTTQRPSLRPPSRINTPFSRRRFVWQYTPSGVISHTRANSSVVMLGFSNIKLRIFSVVTTSPCCLIVAYTINSFCRYSGAGNPASAISRNILSTPSPNSFTSLWLREKCISRILFGLTKPGNIPGLSTVMWSSNNFTWISVPRML